MTNAEAQFNKSLCPRKPEGSLGRTTQDVHLDSHTAPELCQFFDGGQMTKSVTDNSNSSGVSSIVQPPTFFTPSK